MDRPLEAKQSWRSRGKVAAMRVRPTRTRHFTTTIATKVFLLAISLGVALRPDQAQQLIHGGDAAQGPQREP